MSEDNGSHPQSNFPATEEFVDFAGRMRTFHLEQYPCLLGPREITSPTTVTTLAPGVGDIPGRSPKCRYRQDGSNSRRGKR